MELFKVSRNRYLNTSGIVELSLDSWSSTDYLVAHLTDGSRTTLFSIPKDTTIEQAIKQNLITINEGTNEQSIDTDSTL